MKQRLKLDKLEWWKIAVLRKNMRLAHTTCMCCTRSNGTNKSFTGEVDALQEDNNKAIKTAPFLVFDYPKNMGGSKYISTYGVLEFLKDVWKPTLACEEAF